MNHRSEKEQHPNMTQDTVPGENSKAFYRKLAQLATVLCPGTRADVCFLDDLSPSLRASALQLVDTDNPTATIDWSHEIAAPLSGHLGYAFQSAVCQSIVADEKLVALLVVTSEHEMVLTGEQKSALQLLAQQASDYYLEQSRVCEFRKIEDD
ncbi:MAG TPA: hypothetical protein VF719_00285 [Abditibacteriaceae bacterium]